MPFKEHWILSKISECQASGRLAHAYLLTGSDGDALEHLAMELCRLILQSDSVENHGDLHCIRPESKSRRLTVAQIRELEHELQLKSREGGLKVGIVLSADRMCLGKAEAANAFLKTLEEPPDHTVLLLTSDRNEQLLPTIRSRCINLPLESHQSKSISPAELKWITSWIEVAGAPVAKAYRRSQILSQWWRHIRENTESEFKNSSLAEDQASAHVESEFLLRRDQSIGALIREVWKQVPQNQMNHEFAIACPCLEELRSALQRNIDANLALERCHLKIAKSIS